MSQARSFDWVFWLQWVMVSTLGWLLGGVLFFDLALIGVGLVIGLLQWVALRPHISRAGQWVVASAVGWAIGWAFIVLFLPHQAGLFLGAVVGAALGLAQWLVLRQQFHRAGWWIVISTLGWAAGLTGLLGSLFVGTAVGVVTGVAMELYLRFPALLKTRLS